jgi:hypothetical protein
MVERRLVFDPLPLAIAATLASCSPEEPPPDSEMNDAPVAANEKRPEAAGTPSTAEQPTGVAPLTAGGWGPLQIGMTLGEVVAVAGPDSDPEAVGGPEPEACDIFHPAKAPEGLRVMIEDGRLARISISDPTEVKTDRGLGPGDTPAAVKAAYGEEMISSPHEYEEAPAQYLTVWAAGAGREPYVRSSEARGIRYEVDQEGRVDVVHAGGPSIQYVEGCL